MAGRIQGITVEIGGDTTKLQTALKGVNTEIRNTHSQLRDVDKLLKLDPGNTELLAQKHRLLGDAVKETKEKLETVGDNITNVGKKFLPVTGVVTGLGTVAVKTAADLEFCEWVIREIGVAAVPGSSFFREPVNNLIRLHFARGQEVLDEALNRLEKLAMLIY